MFLIRFIILGLEEHVRDPENSQDQEQEVVPDDREREVDHDLVAGVLVDRDRHQYFDPEQVLGLVPVWKDPEAYLQAAYRSQDHDLNHVIEAIREIVIGGDVIHRRSQDPSLDRDRNPQRNLDHVQEASRVVNDRGVMTIKRQHCQGNEAFSQIFHYLNTL